MPSTHDLKPGQTYRQDTVVCIQMSVCTDESKRTKHKRCASVYRGRRNKMSKADKNIIKGFENGGAENIKFYGDGKHRNAEMEIDGQKCIVHKIPSSSHLDDSALFRKARDTARRFRKYGVYTQAW